MDIKYYPNKETLVQAMQVDDPLLMLVSYDEKEVLISNIDDSFEHIILLKKLNYKDTSQELYLVQKLA